VLTKYPDCDIPLKVVQLTGKVYTCYQSCIR